MTTLHPATAFQEWGSRVELRAAVHGVHGQALPEGLAMGPEKSISLLVGHTAEEFDCQRHLAAGDFLGWMFWRNDDSARESFSVCSTLSVLTELKRRAGIGYMSDPSYLKCLACAFDPETILRLTSESAGLFSAWQFVDNDDIFDLVQLIDFLVRFKPPSKDKRKRASLSRAKHFVSSTFEFQVIPRTLYRVITPQTLHRVWRVFTATAPFHFVNERYFHRLWRLEPESQNVFPDLDLIIRDSEKITAFFRSSMYIQNILQKLLDTRAVTEAEFVTFPRTIEALAVELLPWTREENLIASKYKSKPRF